jgi:hypothetical protein
VLCDGTLFAARQADTSTSCSGCHAHAEAQTQCANHPKQSVGGWNTFSGKTFVEAFPAKSRIAGEFCHTPRTGNISECGGKQGGVVIFEDNIQVLDNRLVAAQILCDVKTFQTGDFMGYGLILLGCRQFDCPGNIRTLCGFISAAEHNDYHLTPPDRIHAPTQKFAHFPYIRADRFYITRPVRLCEDAPPTFDGLRCLSSQAATARIQEVSRRVSRALCSPKATACQYNRLAWVEPDPRVCWQKTFD